jgi:hypothetical protein
MMNDPTDNVYEVQVGEPEPVTEEVANTDPILPKGYEFTGEWLRGITPIVRDVRTKEHYDKQNKLYSPCSCGSGKNFKFCCNGKQMIRINTE